MQATPERPPRTSRSNHGQLFRDLRARSEYAAKVSRMLEARRERRIERVMKLQRKHRLHQAR